MAQSRFQFLVILGEDVRNVILTVNKILEKNSFMIEVNGLYYLNDFENQEFDPEEIKNPSETLKKIQNWPTGGWLEYATEGCSLLVCFETANILQIRSIYISAYETEYLFQKDSIEKLIDDLDVYLDFKHSIKGIDVIEDVPQKIESLLKSLK